VWEKRNNKKKKKKKKKDSWSEHYPCLIRDNKQAAYKVKCWVSGIIEGS
jgi:hypothetical protein